MNLQENLKIEASLIFQNKGHVMDLKPIEICGDLPIEQEYFACVWPSTDPMPTVGLVREFLFNGKPLTLNVKEVYLLGDGCVGVVLSKIYKSSQELVH